MIGHAEESAALDFKAQVTGNNRELAKDIAAMTVNGGVLVYGVEEDSTTGVAARITPVTLSGVEERIRQVAGSTIRPAPAIEVDYIRATDGDADGVVVVAIPPSRLVPHMVDGRYPRRDGTTTGRMDEPEVERAYRRRSEGLMVPASSTELFAGVEWLPGLPHVRARSVYNGFGQVRVAAQPAVAEAAHPATPWLGEPLRDALDRTRTRAHQRLTPGGQPPLLAAFHPWRAAGVDGWVAGDASGDEGTLASNDTAAAVVRYPAHIVMQTTFPTVVGGGGGAPPYLCAWEWRVAVEVWTMLTFIGEFLTEVDGGSLAVCGIELAGFAGAVSYEASRARQGLAVSHLPTAPAGVVDSAVVPALELREGSEALVQRFLDRWLVSFYDGAPLMETMLNPQR
ncbi:MAG: ATP-binding protein [Actinomycetota bacterium]|nr:ATP-binding protein [Actinomycetota bacterium]